MPAYQASTTRTYSVADQTHMLSSAGILVVDDHDLVRLGLRTLVHSYVAKSGQTVHIWEARTLQDALAQYRNHKHEIMLVLLDLQLPDAHGLT